MLNISRSSFCHLSGPLSIIVGTTIIFCTQPTYITNICIQLGLIIFNTLGVMLRTDDAGHRIMDAGRRTQDTKHHTISSQMS